jgi:hypothetical protein
VAALQSSGCAKSYYNQVGTRLVLQRAAVRGNLAAGQTACVELTVINSGYGRVIRPRPVSLVFVQNGRAVSQIPVPLDNMDLRTLDSFTANTYHFDVTLPSQLVPGPVSMAVLIPDPATSLSSNAAYALPLNSLDQNGNPIFDPTTGYNYTHGSGPYLGSAFQLDSSGTVTSDPNEVISGICSIKGAYTGGAAYSPFFETVASLLPLKPGHAYQVTFRYKILTNPSTGFEVLFYSPTGAVSGHFLPSVLITGHAGDSGTVTLTNTLGPYSDYKAGWNIDGTGAISIDDIQIIDVASAKVIAAANCEPVLDSPLVVH